MTRSTNMEHVEVLRQAAAVLRESAKQHRTNNCIGHSSMCDGMAADLDAAIASLSAPQPASDGGFTAADMMDARQEGRKEAQQPAAVNGADAKDAEIERLRAEREVIGAEAVKYAEKSGRLEAKVERLADAINAYKSECDNPAKDYVLRAKRRDEMFALLRDHDQEDGNP